MRNLVLMFAFVAFLFGVSNAQGARDGNWWNKLNKDAKVYFVAGFWNGVTWGDDVLRDALNNLKKEGKISDENANDVFNKWNAYTDIGSTKVGEIVDKLDNIYSDGNNLTIRVSDAMTLVVLNIQGLPMNHETMQQLLQIYRGNK